MPLLLVKQHNKNGKKIGGAWYYFNKDASMASKQWLGSYYLRIMELWLKENGFLIKAIIVGSNLKSGGNYASREWIGSYYLKSGGYYG